MKKIIILTIIVLLASVFVYAGSHDAEHSINLPAIHAELSAGSGKEKAETLCNICHSLDYITMQPRFSKAQWTATVNKMIKVMGAPINDEDAKVIINYLATAYGTGN